MGRPVLCSTSILRENVDAARPVAQFNSAAGLVAGDDKRVPLPINHNTVRWTDLLGSKR